MAGRRQDGNLPKHWETTISGMATEIDDANLTEMLLAQMTYSKELKEQVQRFRK